MEQHTIDIVEREHQQEKWIEVTDHIRLQMKSNTPRANEPLPDEPCIFRVHEGLCHVNEKAYTPMLVSIGPYHHGHPKLLPMEKHKEHYFELLLQRNNQRNEEYLDSMKKLEERARKYYANPTDHLNSGEFVKMMLNDACFVIEFLVGIHEYFLVKHQHQLRQEGQQLCHVSDNTIVKVSWMRMHICQDLILLENQLPFFVLSEFYSMSCRRTENPNQKHPTLIELAKYPITCMLPRRDKIQFENRHFNESKHFLDLVQMFVIILVSQSMQSTPPPELEEAGVTFEERKEVSMFDIVFEHGHFKIPKFEVCDSTEIFFRNIIAYEQHSSDDKPKYFTDYTFFMDLLIKSKEDVNKLRRNKVIDNMLGDDEAALMFKNLGKGKIILQHFCYAKLCSKVNAHCETWWYRGVASLKPDYFKNMWVTVATFAVAFLLLLTLTQTVISVITMLASLSPR
ncbi:UPF0481 protein At3g47200-like [Camellia sinensis]|uniref:UPF0481 protein At3g47200-like n=1 Tax=Camellia sinensis TaxID=4442 RepID=UPI0010361EEF|nr:UPF0481 protein At3g47200-like [Camellia sinensis]